MMRRGVGGLSLVCACMLVASLAEARSDNSAEVARGAVVGTSRAFVKGARNQLEALSLKTGKRMWRSPSASYPLIVHRGRLLAVTPKGGLVLLHPATGKVARKCTSPGRSTSFALGGNKHVRAFISRGRVIVQWSATRSWGKGRSKGTSGKQNKGRLKVNFPSCTVTKLHRFTTTPADLVIKSKKVGIVYRIGPYKIGGTGLTIEQLVTKNGTLVKVLRRNGNQTVSKELLSTNRTDVKVVVSRDGKHVIVAMPAGKAYTGSVYAVTTAKKIGPVRRLPSAFVLRGGTVVHATSSGLTGLSTVNGLHRWTYRFGATRHTRVRIPGRRK